MQILNAGAAVSAARWLWAGVAGRPSGKMVGADPSGMAGPGQVEREGSFEPRSQGPWGRGSLAHCWCPLSPTSGRKDDKTKPEFC